MRPVVALLLLCLLAACAVPQSTAPVRPMGPTLDTATRDFAAVVARVEPVAESLCRARAPNLDCDLQIAIDARRGQPPNAFQTLDRRNRPVIVFTQALIADVQNADELAFILGHEAAHHIAGHIPRTEANAALGAILLGSVVQASGQGPAAVRQAIEIGAAVGARTFSKDFELEADALGTIIAARAGFDPVRGVAYFTRIPDPGDVFLGTHPPNADRIALVRRTAAGL